MFFVHKFISVKPYGFIENNIRIGGFKTVQGALNQAKKHAPCIIRDDRKILIGQTVDKDLPYHVA